MHSWKGPEKWCRGERVEGERGSKGPESEAANIYRSRSRRTDKVLYCLKVARPVAKTQEVVVSKSCIHPVVRRRKGNPCTGVGTHCFLEQNGIFQAGGCCCNPTCHSSTPPRRSSSWPRRGSNRPTRACCKPFGKFAIACLNSSLARRCSRNASSARCCACFNCFRKAAMSCPR